MSNLALYPCDRGMPANSLGRGYHNFVLSAGATHAACTYCGQIGTARRPPVVSYPVVDTRADD